MDLWQDQFSGGRGSTITASERMRISETADPNSETQSPVKSSSTKSAPANAEFSLTEARSIINDLFEPNPRIYWTDFLLTLTFGFATYGMVRRVDAIPYLNEMSSSAQWGVRGVCFVISSLLFYRAAMFIHELVHLRREKFTTFRAVWNLLCGFPFLTPSFIYYPHIDHHRRKHFGTDRDGEYLPLGQRSSWYSLFYLSWNLVIPVIAVARFLVFTPIAWVYPPFRRWVHRHVSSLVMDPTYIRPLPSKKVMRTIYIQEGLCFAYCFSIAALPPIFLDRWAGPFVLHAYCTGVFILTVNAIRTLGAHRWHNNGSELSFTDQLLDSVNVAKRPWLTEIWGPVGTRFHALHHLFPTLPYHQMPAAHRRLCEQLPADSIYHLTEEPSLTAALLDLYRRTQQNKTEEVQEDSTRRYRDAA